MLKSILATSPGTVARLLDGEGRKAALVLDAAKARALW